MPHKPQTANRELQTEIRKPRRVRARTGEQPLEETSFPVLTAAIITIYQIRDPHLQAPKGSKVPRS